MPVASSTGASTGNWGSVTPARVLLMAEDPTDNMACTEALESSGCEVRSCSSYIELLLYLEHESFQLVMIFERKNSENQWREFIREVAEIDHGTPVRILNEIRDAQNLFGKRQVGRAAA